MMTYDPIAVSLITYHLLRILLVLQQKYKIDLGSLQGFLKMTFDSIDGSANKSISKKRYSHEISNTTTIVSVVCNKIFLSIFERRLLFPPPVNEKIPNDI